MNGSNGDVRHLLDRYLDGDLAGAELEAFEARLGRDSSLRAEITRQERIDDGLRRLLAPPQNPPRIAALEARPEAAERDHPSPPVPLTRRRTGIVVGALAAAAVLALAAAGVWWQAGGARPTKLDRLYAFQVEHDWTPLEVCTTADAFQGWVEKYYGVPLRPRPGATERIEFIGWRYDTTLSGLTGVLLARADDQPLFVLVDRLEHDGVLEPPRRHDALRLHRREVGGLVLYEVSPFERPRVIGALAVAPE